MRKYILFFGLLSILFVSCQSTAKKDDSKKVNGYISISGAFALYPLTVKWVEEFKKSYPEISIDVSAGGAGKGMTDVLSGMVNIAMFSREISESEIEKGAFGIAVAKDAVLPVMNSKNPVKESIYATGVSQSNLQKIFKTGEIIAWEQLTNNKGNSNIELFTRSDACGAGAMWGEYLGINQEDLKGIGVFGDPGMSDAIKSNKNAIGYNNLIYIYDIKTREKVESLDVVPIDINGNGSLDASENFYSNLDSLMKAIKTGNYPSPPARNLYFIVNGKPTDKAVITFIEWVLTEGQKYIVESGYVELTNEKISSELKKINQ